MLRVSHDIKMKCHHNERHRAAARRSSSFNQSHKYAPGMISEMEDLSDMSGIRFSLIAPGAMSGTLKSLSGMFISHKSARCTAFVQAHTATTIQHKSKELHAMCSLEIKNPAWGALVLKATFLWHKSVFFFKYFPSSWFPHHWRNERETDIVEGQKSTYLTAANSQVITEPAADRYLISRHTKNATLREITAQKKKKKASP